MIRRIVFVLGSNIGDRAKNIEDAVGFLKQELALTSVKKSFLMQNPAMLPKDAPQDWDKEFLNLAISGDINLNKFPPSNILSIIKQIEKNIGRIDRGNWSPREIDIDIALIQGIKLNSKELCIPHQSLTQREFFILPIANIEKKLLLNIFPNLYDNREAFK